MLKQGAKRDPELFILAAVVGLGMAGVGYFSGLKSQKPNSESSVVMAKHEAMPWTATDAEKNADHHEMYKYRYHPGGDPRNPAREAPSALHRTLVSVRASDEIREKFDKQGKI